MDPSKKVSFGFSKLKKTNQLVKPVPEEKHEVQFVDAFDGDKGKFSYQGTRIEEAVKKPLVIPLVGTRSAYDVIKAKLDEKNDANGGKVLAGDIEDVKPSLDVLAAQEILSGVNGEVADESEAKTMVIVTDEKPTFTGEKESSLEDYENVPVDDFGLAMLRGMGWTPETGIGKDGKVVEPITTELRPKRLGLGAKCPKPPGERLPMKKGSHVEILAGLHKNTVGIVEAMDGDTASVFIKLSGGRVLSISENWVVAITPKEFERKLNGVAVPKPEPDKKYGIVKKENAGDGKKASSQLEQAMRQRKRDKRMSSSPEQRKRSRDRGRKKSKKHRRKSSSEDDRPKKSKKHRR